MSFRRQIVEVIGGLCSKLTLDLTWGRSQRINQFYSRWLLGKSGVSPHVSDCSNRPHGQPPNFGSTGRSKEIPMKQIMLAVALIVASAAPVMAQGFPNLYQTQR
jgi:hypothetical protein